VSAKGMQQFRVRRSTLQRAAALQQRNRSVTVSSALMRQYDTHIELMHRPMRVPCIAKGANTPEARYQLSSRSWTMTKRRIGFWAAAAVLSLQAGLAAAEVTAVPLGAEDLMARSEPPSRTTYQAQHPDAAPGATSAIPLGAEELAAKTEPRLQTTFRDQHAPATADGSAVPLDTEELAARAEPPLRSTFQSQHGAATSQHAATAFTPVN
jgi:hypothetical protein